MTWHCPRELLSSLHPITVVWRLSNNLKVAPFIYSEVIEVKSGINKLVSRTYYQ